MLDPADIGTRFDEPADSANMQAGQGITLFALLKGVLLELKMIRTALAETQDQTGETN